MGYCGIARTYLRQVLAAAALNLTRLADWLALYARGDTAQYLRQPHAPNCLGIYQLDQECGRTKIKLPLTPSQQSV
jgi:hypothetical protein